MQAGELRPGTAILFSGQIHVVTEYQHVTPGNWRAMIQTTLKNLKTGKSIKNRFRPQESVEQVILDSRPCQYLYHDQTSFYFLDLEDYHNHAVSSEMMGEKGHFLPENFEVKLRMHESQVVDVELPASVNLKVVKTEPGSRGDTVTNVTKAAVLETGFEVHVPIFIKEGERIKVDTRTGEYLGRS